MVDFANKANLTLHGTTWDAKHLDKFLKSEWGDRLFNASKSNQPPEPAKNIEGIKTVDTNIRPSPAFLTLPRSSAIIAPVPTQAPVITGVVTHTQFQDNQQPISIQKKDHIEISKKMQKIEQELKGIREAQMERVTPDRRRQLFEGEKKREQMLKKLKEEKAMITKQNRIIKSGYPEGILGVDAPNLPDTKLYWKEQKEIERSRSLQANRWQQRAQNIMKNTSTSPGITFSNPNSAELPGEKVRAKKKVDEIPEQYHDTFGALFVPKTEKRDPDRAQRLKELNRGERNFDIISGAYYKF